MNSRSVGIWWPRSIVLFFIVVAAAQVFLVLKANSGRSLAVEERPYEKGLGYERIIVAKNNASAAGIKVSYRYDADGLVAAFSNLPPGTAQRELSLEFLRSNDSSLDFRGNKSDFGDLFKFEAAKLRPGLYIVRANLKIAEAEYYFESKELVPN